jgi:hypothetical protein
MAAVSLLSTGTSLIHGVVAPPMAATLKPRVTTDLDTTA